MKILIARIADSFERPGEVLSIEGRPATMVELHGPFDLGEWREDVHRQEIDGCTGLRIRIDEVSIRVKFEDEKDRMCFWSSMQSCAKEEIFSIVEISSRPTMVEAALNLEAEPFTKVA